MNAGKLPPVRAKEAVAAYQVQFERTLNRTPSVKARVRAKGASGTMEVSSQP